jgi:putative ABC transport system ATP-binding protein
MSKTVIELQNIKRNFQVGDETVHALRGVSFSIGEGEFVTIMGTSGSGKSTLLNILGCLDTPTVGEYLLDGISVRTMSKSQRAVLRNRKIGFVFQNYNLLAKTTAVENVELPLMYNSSVSAAERRKRAIEALKAVGLGDRLEHKSNQMSGGQMQRVAIARALVNNPAVILAALPGVAHGSHHGLGAPLQSGQHGLDLGSALLGASRQRAHFVRHHRQQANQTHPHPSPINL